MASRREEAALPLEAAELATGISLEVRWRLLVADLGGVFVWRDGLLVVPSGNFSACGARVDVLCPGPRP